MQQPPFGGLPVETDAAGTAVDVIGLVAGVHVFEIAVVVVEVGSKAHAKVIG